MMAPVLCNGAFKLQVPIIPWEHLIAFTALYCGLYMGGHSVKASAVFPRCHEGERCASPRCCVAGCAEAHRRPADAADTVRSEDT
jgi:hypothetical protein